MYFSSSLLWKYCGELTLGELIRKKSDSDKSSLSPESVVNAHLKEGTAPRKSDSRCTRRTNVEHGQSLLIMLEDFSVSYLQVQHLNGCSARQPTFAHTLITV